MELLGQCGRLLGAVCNRYEGNADRQGRDFAAPAAPLLMGVELSGLVRARRPERVPAVIARDNAAGILLARHAIPAGLFGMPEKGASLGWLVTGSRSRDSGLFNASTSSFVCVCGRVTSQAAYSHRHAAFAKKPRQ